MLAAAARARTRAQGAAWNDNSDDDDDDDDDDDKRERTARECTLWSQDIPMLELNHGWPRTRATTVHEGLSRHMVYGRISNLNRNSSNGQHGATAVGTRGTTQLRDRQRTA